MKIAKKPFLLLIRAYQRALSPDRGWVRFIIPMRPTCAMYPSCSQYAYEAIDKYGVIYGLFKSSRRILRCHPYQKKLIDEP